MAKIVKTPRKRRLPDEAEPAIERLREITAQSANNLLLGEGPAHPDAALLDLCSEALHLLKEAEQRNGEWAVLEKPGSWRLNSPEFQAFSTERDRLWGEHDQAIAKAKPLLSRIRKMRAKTAAGIYAKALVVRSSRTGAPLLAMSLADDLIACPGLRESLWPAEGETATT